MNHLQKLIKRKPEEKGQGLVEYALLIALIAVVVIAILGTLGNKVADVYNDIIFALSGASQYNYEWATTFNVTPNNTTDCNIKISASGLGVKVTDDDGAAVEGVSVSVSVQLQNGVSKTFSKTTGSNGKVLWSGDVIGTDSPCGGGAKTATASIADLSDTAGY